MNKQQMQARIKEIEAELDAEERGAEADAGFDAGEFSGPMHGRRMDALFDEMIQLKEILSDQAAEEAKMDAEIEMNTRVVKMTPPTEIKVRILREVPTVKTKQQEMDQLRAFAKKVEPGGYLASLFTADLLSWVETNIRSDMPSDVFSLAIDEGAKLSQAEQSLRKALEISQDHKSRAERLQGELDSRDATLKQLRSDTARVIDRASRFEQMANDLTREAKEWQDRYHALNEDYESLMEEHGNVKQMLAAVETHRDAALKDLERKDLEILKIKASVFDIIAGLPKDAPADDSPNIVLEPVKRKYVKIGQGVFVEATDLNDEDPGLSGDS